MAVTLGFSVPSEPGLYAEVDSSQAGVSGRSKSKVLVLGQKLASGSAPADKPIFVPSVAAAQAYFGRGSIIERTIRAVKAAYSGAEIWACAQSDADGAIAASGTITVTATTAKAGTIHLYIGGQHVQVPVAEGDSANTIAANIAAYITDSSKNPYKDDLPVTASATANTVTLTAKNKGTLGNRIDVRVNHFGTSGGEVLPEGVSLSIATMSGGATDPAISAALAAIAGVEYDTIVCPYLDSANLTSIKTEMASRWDPLVMLYGHVVSAIVDTYDNLVSYSANLKNDPHLTVLGLADVPQPCWEVAGILGGLTAKYQMDADDETLAKGFTGLLMPGLYAARPGHDLTMTERDILLSKGLATARCVGGSVYLSRARTTYLTDANGNADAAFYDQRTLAILQRIIRGDKAAFLAAFAGSVLVADDEGVGGGVKVLSPKIARGWFAARYAAYREAGLVTDLDRFLEDLVIEVNASDPNRLDVLYPPQLTGWLAVAAMRVAFRLL